MNIIFSLEINLRRMSIFQIDTMYEETLLVLILSGLSLSGIALNSIYSISPSQKCDIFGNICNILMTVGIIKNELLSFVDFIDV